MQLMYTLYTPYTCASQGGSCGESETSVITMSGSTCIVWQFVVFLVLCQATLMMIPKAFKHIGN
jgi:hypothetical protein